MTKKKMSIIFIVVLFFAGVLYGALYLMTFHPPALQEQQVRCQNAPVLQKGQALKVLNWNVQYLAGRSYIFWYDCLDQSGKSCNDAMVSSQDVMTTLDEVARVIQEENPDIVLWQELHFDSKRTNYIDQEKLLLEKLPQYSCATSAFYLKNRFIPHPKIMGSENLKLGIFSKYKVEQAWRHQLPILKENWLVAMFNFKRTMLEAYLPIEQGSKLAVISTHLDAFAQGSDTMQKQVEAVDALLTKLDQEKISWIIGGDFNLLSQNNLRERLPAGEQLYYNPQTEMNMLSNKYNIIPSFENVVGKNFQDWCTYSPNDKKNWQPNRTIDYVLYSAKLSLQNKKVRQGEDTWQISDHMPIIAEFLLSND